MGDKKATPADLVAYLTAQKPPEDIVVEVTFGDDAERRTTELHFQRSMAAFSRYVRTAWMDRQPLEAGLQFLMDTVSPAEREALEMYVNAYPVDAGALANQIVNTYAGGSVESALKNGSRPAGP
jgi:hypothetical protein